MTCATSPVFWRQQPRWPVSIRRFVRERLEAALEAPRDRALLVWPTVLGAPKVLEAHPDGLPEGLLLEQARLMLQAVGTTDPASAWRECLERFPDTAESIAGWRPAESWRNFAPELSLRCGVALLALTGRPEGENYRLSCAVELFNHALFHECHDALEGLWREADGELRRGLQELILLAAGFHHQQQQHGPGMLELWKEGLSVLETRKGILETPWGRVDVRKSLELALRRRDWLKEEGDFGELWSLPRPEWELM